MQEKESSSQRTSTYSGKHTGKPGNLEDANGFFLSNSLVKLSLKKVVLKQILHS